jgi:hypothetical protein
MRLADLRSSRNFFHSNAELDFLARFLKDSDQFENTDWQIMYSTKYMSLYVFIKLTTRSTNVAFSVVTSFTADYKLQCNLVIKFPWDCCRLLYSKYFCIFAQVNITNPTRWLVKFDVISYYIHLQVNITKQKFSKWRLPVLWVVNWQSTLLAVISELRRNH